jgi:hypothetical protein
MLPFCKNLCFVQGDVPFEPDAGSLGFLCSRWSDVSLTNTTSSNCKGCCISSPSVSLVCFSESRFLSESTFPTQNLARAQHRRPPLQLALVRCFALCGRTASLLRVVGVYPLWGADEVGWGTPVWNMCLDSSGRHGSWTTQLRTDSSDVARGFRTLDARAVRRIPRQRHSQGFQAQGFQARQGRQILSQAGITGCTRGKACFFLKRCFKYWRRVRLSDLVRAFSCSSVPGPTSAILGARVVGRASTFGDQRRRCASNARRAVPYCCAGAGACRLVRTSL